MSAQMDFPHHIAHTPVYALPYNAHDPRQPGDSDVQFLTVGWSQWDRDEPSAKIVRHTGNRWSRQSEEIPLARLVDLMILLGLVFEDSDTSLSVAKGFFENQAEPLTIKKKSEKARDTLAAALHRDPVLRRRMRTLAGVMDRLKEKGQI
ncbi:MAG: hypothetical protein H7X78_01700 [Methyloceanibacter sp.]|nr:hypothetical protein [Methyloceanibacter sp.]